MRPLRAKFDELESLLLRHRRTLAQNTGVPFVRLVYHPGEETRCQHERELLRRSLEQTGLSVETVSCQGAIFAYYERRGRLDQLFELDRVKTVGLDTNIASHGRQELLDRLLATASRLGGDGVIFLTETAFAYPYLSLGIVH